MVGIVLHHPEFVTDPVDIEGYEAGTVSLSTTAAASAALEEGIYDVWADVDCYIRLSAAPTAVTTSNGYLMRVGNTMPYLVKNGSKIGAIVASGTGTLKYHKVG